MLSQRTLAAALSLAATASGFAQGRLFISLERDNEQISAGSTNPVEYAVYATVEDLAGAASASLAINGGDPLNLPPDNNLFEQVAYYPLTDLGQMLSDVPLNGSYTFNVTGTASGSTTFNGPGGTFASLLPSTPVFTISGVSGSWVSSVNGPTFQFNPEGLTSFTITMSAFSAPTAGGHRAYYVAVDDNGLNQEIGEAEGGPIENSEPAETVVLTFTWGLARDAGDTDPLTYGIDAESNYLVEGGHFNIFNLGETSLTGANGAVQGFIVGQTTYFNLQAIPEPATYAQFAGFLALSAAFLRRRSRATAAQAA